MHEQFLRATVSIRGVVRTPGDTLLTIRRASDGGWELPGGRIRERESVEACLRRETREETGLDVAVHGPVDATAWRNDADQGRLAVYYRCSGTEGDVSLSEEHVDHEWVERTAALERLSGPQGRAVDRAFDAGTLTSTGTVR